MEHSNATELTSIIQLIRSENVGVKTFWNLISIYKNAKNALDNIESFSTRAGKLKPIKVFSKTKAEDEISACAEKKIQIVSYLDSSFPNLLKNTEDCPPILYCLGNISLLNRKNIAIVGSRNASANGLRFAYKVSKNLAEHNHVIVSGLARGIDTAAHKASVEKGTIAVLAGGLGHIYPPENEELYYKISDQGLIIAELPIGSIPMAQHFPQRNRIISGISSGTAIIESGLKSGSLITARLALQQNREIFAVPGFPLDPNYQGNNYLLKQGAHLLESAEDILEILESSSIKRSSLFNQEKKDTETFRIEDDLTDVRKTILSLLGSSSSSVDEIISITKFSIDTVLTAIVELELSGKISRHSGNKISIIL